MPHLQGISRAITKIRTVCQYIIVLVSTLFVSIYLSLSFPQYSFAADASNNSEIMQQVKSLRTSIESSQREYLSAVQYAQQLDSQYEVTQKELDDLHKKLEDRKGDLDSIIIDEYKTPIVDTFLNAIVGSGTIEQVFEQIEYANRIAQDRIQTTGDVVTLSKKAEEKREELEIKKGATQQAMLEAEAAKSVWQERLDEMRPQIKKIRSEYFSQVADTTGYAQLDAALTYLEDVDSATDEQIRILQAAYNTGYSGSNYCERWAEAVFRNAGVAHGNFISANSAAQSYVRNTDLNSIPVGALVYGSGTSVPYGHVGICVAAGTGNMDALIIDNEGSRTKTAVPLYEWAEWQTAYSWSFGKSGLYGWGYPDSIVLEPVTN